MQSSVNLGIWRDSKWSEQAWTDPALEKKHINNILPLKWCLACIEHCVLWQNVLLKLQEPFSVCQDIFKCLYAFIIIFWEWGGLWGRVTLMMLTEDSGLGSSVSKNCSMYWNFIILFLPRYCLRAFINPTHQHLRFSVLPIYSIIHTFIYAIFIFQQNCTLYKIYALKNKIL